MNKVGKPILYEHPKKKYSGKVVGGSHSIKQVEENIYQNIREPCVTLNNFMKGRVL